MRNNFKPAHRNSLNSFNESLSLSLDYVNSSSFNEAFMLHINEINIGMLPYKLDVIKKFLPLNNNLDLIILIDKSGFNLKIKHLQEIFVSQCFPSREEFIKVLKASKLAIASFGQSKSIFKIDEAIKDALRNVSKSINLLSAKAMLLHIRFSYPLSTFDFYRAIEILREALNNQEAPVCCSFKLERCTFLKALLILTGFNSIEELIGDKSNDVLSSLFNLEPEVSAEEKYLNLDLGLPIIDMD